ncbi:MAG: SDR family NAD(P)-dependent oxidoreductase, partial [Candidatus Rokuibacteriota bacterium]
MTGAGSGIGRGIAQALAARGARVAAVDIDGASAAE